MTPSIVIYKQFVDAINGEESKLANTFQYDPNGAYITMSQSNGTVVDVISIRGWGYLTGTGGLHLSDKEACKIQDEFGQFICNRLNSKILYE